MMKYSLPMQAFWKRILKLKKSNVMFPPFPLTVMRLCPTLSALKQTGILWCVSAYTAISYLCRELQSCLTLHGNIGPNKVLMIGE